MFRFRSRVAKWRVQAVWEFGSRLQYCRIRCRACDRVVILPPQQAIATFGGMTTLTALEPRLRCTHCGAKQAQVSGVYREGR